jgi:hypothetical protein
VIQSLIGVVLYLFTLVATFAIVLGLPVVLFSLIMEHRRNRITAIPIFIAVAVAAGFLIGGLTGWLVRPFEWSMPLWETAYASLNAATYGHELESKAERVFLYFLFCCDIGAVVTGIGAAAVARLRIRGAQPA